MSRNLHDLSVRAEIVAHMRIVLDGIFPCEVVLQGSAARMVDALWEMGEGHREPFDTDPERITFPSKTQARWVLCDDIPYTSLCKHHILPFTGMARVAYRIPKKECRVIGFSKIPRLVEHLSRRLSLQEELTSDIMTKMHNIMARANPDVILEPFHVIVQLTGQHTCVKCRGVRSEAHYTTLAHTDSIVNSEQAVRILNALRCNG